MLHVSLRVTSSVLPTVPLKSHSHFLLPIKNKCLYSCSPLKFKVSFCSSLISTNTSSTTTQENSIESHTFQNTRVLICFLPSHTLGCTEMEEQLENCTDISRFIHICLQFQALVLVMIKAELPSAIQLPWSCILHISVTLLQKAKLLSFAIQRTRTESLLSEECSAS